LPLKATLGMNHARSEKNAHVRAMPSAPQGES